MKQLLQEIGNLTKEKEDSQKGWEIDVRGNWCYPEDASFNPSATPMTESEFNTRLREFINAYIKRLAKQAYEGA